MPKLNSTEILGDLRVTNDATVDATLTTNSLSVEGNILLTGDATTTNQGRLIDFTGFDKEGTTDFSDRAFIQHTTNTGGHSGSVLLISSQNDSSDGIAFSTNASSRLKHNSNNIITDTTSTQNLNGDINMGANTIDFNANSGNSTTAQIIGDRSTTDLDTRNFTTEGGFSYTTFDGSTSNKPSGSYNNANGVITMNTHSGAYNWQLAFTNNQGKMFARYRNGGSYSSWNEILTSASTSFVTSNASDTMSGDYRIESGSFASLILDRGTTGSGSVVQFENNNGVIGGIGAYGDDGLQFRTSDGTQMVLNASNNLGIGTTSPTAKLDVNGALNLKGRVFGDSDGTNSYLKSGTSGKIYFETNGGTRGAIDTSGNFGIGTLSPAEKLHIDGGSIYVVDDGGNPRVVLGDNLNTGGYGQIQWNSSTDILQLGSSLDADSLVINESGYIGIGTTSPNSRLQIDGTGGDSWNRNIGLSMDGTELGKIVVDNDGIKYRTMVSSDSHIFRNSSNSTTLTISHTGTVTANYGRLSSVEYNGSDVDKVNFALNTSTQTLTITTT